MKLQCVTTGCHNSVEVYRPVSPIVNYLCREHSMLGIPQIHFQEVQFDPQLGSGVDPKSYERGHSGFRMSAGKKIRKSEETNRKPYESSRARRERVQREIAAELAEHENKKKILDILNEDTRQHNSGLAK